MEGFLANTVKYLLFATNLLVMLMGFIVLGLGIYVLAVGKDVLNLVWEGSDAGLSLTMYSSLAILMIVSSIVVIVIAFFGCCGSVKEKKWMLAIYFALILVLFVIMIVVVALGQTQSLDQIAAPLKKSMNKFNPDRAIEASYRVVTNTWEAFQTQYKCCGVLTPLDWQESSPYFPLNRDGQVIRVPSSCCRGVVDDSQVNLCLGDPRNTNPALIGCFTKLDATLSNHKTAVLGIIITILIVMFLNLLFAFAMWTMIK